MEAKVISVCINEERGQLKHPISPAVFIENKGIEGDGHQGDWGRQVTCLDYEALLKSNEEHNKSMQPGEMAENVLISHMDDLDLQVGDKFRLGNDVILEVTQIGKEDHPSIVTRTFGVSLLPYVGRFCRVVHGGIVLPNDKVEKV